VIDEDRIIATCPSCRAWLRGDEFLSKHIQHEHALAAQVRVNVLEHSQIVAGRLEVSERREEIHDQMEFVQARERPHVRLHEIDREPRCVIPRFIEQKCRKIDSRYCESLSRESSAVAARSAAEIENVASCDAGQCNDLIDLLLRERESLLIEEKRVQVLPQQLVCEPMHLYIICEAMMKLTSISVILAAALLASERRQEISLWPNGAPGSENQTGKELVEPPAEGRNYTRVTNIHNPTLTVYLPKAGTGNGAGIVVAPGGGHRMLAMHEGYDIAEWLAGKGIAAFVLKYRLGREPNSPYKVDVHPTQDGLRAVRLVRSRAKEWGVDPSRIGMMGFSAGGEVVLRASTGFDSGNASATDPSERVSSRPDFQALVYPGILSVPVTAISKDTPPAFLICTHDDKSPATSIPAVYTALLKAGVPAEMHVYARGGHGYGIRNRPLPVSSWPARFEEWLSDQILQKR
jgi:acetyl esterase/lipase